MKRKQFSSVEECKRGDPPDVSSRSEWALLATVLGILAVVAALVFLNGCTSISYTSATGATTRYLSVLQTKSIAIDSSITSATMQSKTSIKWDTNSDPAVKAMELAFQAGVAAGKSTIAP